MTATPYKAVTWGNEPVSSSKLSQMTNNDQWLYEQMPTMYYNGSGVTKNSSLKVYAVRVAFPPAAKSTQSTNVYFGNRFSTACSPIVTTGATGGVFSRKQTLVRGLNGKNVPDSTGCLLTVMIWEPSQYTQTFRSACYVDLIAVGW